MIRDGILHHMSLTQNNCEYVTLIALNSYFFSPPVGICKHIILVVTKVMLRNLFFFSDRRTGDILKVIQYIQYTIQNVYSRKQLFAM